MFAHLRQPGQSGQRELVICQQPRQRNLQNRPPLPNRLRPQLLRQNLLQRQLLRQNLLRRQLPR